MHPLILLGGALFAYMTYSKQASVKPAVPTSKPSNYQPAQPSQNYPWLPITPPRVDNSNQPWYNGPLSAVTGSTSNGNPTAVLAAVPSVIHSLSDIWGTLSPNTVDDGAEDSASVSSGSQPETQSDAMNASGWGPSGSIGDEYSWEYG